MFKSIFILIALTLLALLGMDYFIRFLTALAAFHHFILTGITNVLPGTGPTKLISDLLALLIIPIIVGLIPAFLYFLFRRREMPQTTEIIWIVWAILLTTVAMHR